MSNRSQITHYRPQGEAGAVVVSHGVNKGKGSAVMTSLGYAAEQGFDALVLLDGDGQHDPGEIPGLFGPITTSTPEALTQASTTKSLSNDAADLVIGFRSFGQMPFYRRFGRAALDHITGAGGAVTDSQSGFRALNRKATLLLAGTLKKDDFSIESEMMRASQDMNLRMVEVQIQCRYGDFDTSAKNPVSHGFGVPGSVIRIIAEKRPLLYIGVPGFTLCLVRSLLRDTAASGV